MKFLLAISIGIFVSACQTRVVSLVLPVSAIDNPDQARIAVNYRNETGIDICMAVEDWPKEYGNLHEASDSVYLLVYGQRFPFEENNMGYCVGPCTMRIAAHQELDASIPYEKFVLPERLRRAPKVLVYSPAAHVCSKRELRDSSRVVAGPSPVVVH